MSREMKSPLEKIISLMTDSESAIAGRSAEIKDAARYLLSLVDELGTFADAHPQVKP